MISNQTQKTNIASKVKVCKNFFSLGRGLMLKKPQKQGQGMVLDLGRERNGGIHTYFVLSKIDVIWLNENKEVIDTQKSIKPFRFHLAPNTKARYILELPEGSIQRTKTQKGDKIKLI